MRVLLLAVCGVLLAAMVDIEMAYGDESLIWDPKGLVADDALEVLWEEGGFTEGAAAGPDGAMYFSQLSPCASPSAKRLGYMEVLMQEAMGDSLQPAASVSYYWNLCDSILEDLCRGPTEDSLQLLPTDTATPGQSQLLATRAKDLRMDVSRIEKALGRAMPTLSQEVARL